MEKDRLIAVLTFFYLARVTLLWLFVGLVLVGSGMWLVHGEWWSSRSQITDQAASTEVARQSGELIQPVHEIPVVNTPLPTLSTPVLSPQAADLAGKRTVIVHAGDSLWAIAEREYGDGSKYTALAHLNGIDNPRQLTIGRELQLPEKVGTTTPESGRNLSSEFENNSIIHTNHTVQPGECLWTIAQEQLGDPYRWQEIYEVNRFLIGTDPNVIYPTTILVLPQPQSATMQEVRK